VSVPESICDGFTTTGSCGFDASKSHRTDTKSVPCDLDWLTFVDHAYTMTKLTIRVDFETGGSIGPGKVQLLEAVGRSGSIRKAAERCGMSFRQGWLLLQAIEELFGEALTQTVRGGSRGGGSRLTALGETVVSTYRQLESRAADAAEAEMALLTQRIRHTSSPKSATPAKNPAHARKSLKRKK
jgi:molybdate transport system regulatory protein